LVKASKLSAAINICIQIDILKHSVYSADQEIYYYGTRRIIIVIAKAHRRITTPLLQVLFLAHIPYIIRKNRLVVSFQNARVSFPPENFQPNDEFLKKKTWHGHQATRSHPHFVLFNFLP
jgi:hypothetical protein